MVRPLSPCREKGILGNLFHLELPDLLPWSRGSVGNEVLPCPAPEARHDPASRGRSGSDNLISDGDVESNPGPPPPDRAGRAEAAMSADTMGECCRTRVAELVAAGTAITCLLYTSPSPRDRTRSRMPSSA
eukprot:TRINITY_DN35275_c0_g1_i1.p1 TRINITY_DN35275_c0_g1~~TRINITY_DN35275_c0_g1_i1.p1  ORF type:complete len:131 (+),score=10.05 TRINITY_DN35275_c0_g1_i1:168-560(+)